MNKYNLDEQLSNKTIPQIQRMISARAKKMKAADEIVWNYSDYPYSDSERYRRLVAKAEDVRSDVGDWFDSAVLLFSKDLWENMVSNAGLSLESHGYDELIENI